MVGSLGPDNHIVCSLSEEYPEFYFVVVIRLADDGASNKLLNQNRIGIEHFVTMEAFSIFGGLQDPQQPCQHGFWVVTYGCPHGLAILKF